MTTNEPPLEPGWLVTYKGRKGRVGADKAGWVSSTVKTCRMAGGYTKVILTNGDLIPLSAIVTVGVIDAAGSIVWTGPPAAARGEGGEGA